MEILFIGPQNLLNDSIREIIRAEFGITMNRVDPDQIKQFSEDDPDQQNSYCCVFVDLKSFNEHPESVISYIRESIEPSYLVVTHTYTSDVVIQPLLESGADYYLPSQCDRDLLLNAFGNCINYNK